MPSIQARICNLAARRFVRTDNWGADETEVARRARKIFGSPKFFQRLHTRKLKVSPVRGDGFRGEWIEPDDFSEGVILYLHGGGFVACSPATHRPITATLTRKTKFRTLAPDYRLAPEHKFPAALDDCETAYRRLLDGDTPPEKIAVAGDSAGGGLVLSLLLRLREKDLPRPACGICFSPWTDLKGTGDSKHENEDRCVMFHPDNLNQFAPAYLGEEPAENPFCSPVFAELRDLPPVLIQVSSNELLLDDARRIHQKIQAGNGTSELEIYEDLMHCWQMLAGFIPEANKALTKAADFILRHIV